MAKLPELSLPYRYHPPQEAGKKGAFFLLHGYGSNEDDLFSFVEDLPREFHYFSVQAPHSLEPFGYAWYAIDFDAVQGKWSNTEQAIESRELLMHFIEEASEKFNLEKAQLNLLGFSQGCILSFALGLSYPQKFHRIIGLSGYINEDLLASTYREKDHSLLKIYSSHGQVDPVIPVEWAQRTPEFLKGIGAQIRYEEFPVGHGVSPQNFESFKNWIIQTSQG